MNEDTGARSFRRIVIAAITALGFAGLGQSIEPARAFPILAPIAPEAGTAAMPSVGRVAYYGYRRHYYPRHHRRYYGYARRGQCRYNGINSHLSKRYCRVP